jgi:hypothetical protein
MHSSCIELWRIVEEGFKAMDPNNLRRREVVDSQLNVTTLHMIQIAIGSKTCHISNISPPPRKLGKVYPMCLLAMRA